jgi:hypothetical protein
LEALFATSALSSGFAKLAIGLYNFRYAKESSTEGSTAREPINFDFMNKTDLTPRKEFKQAASHSSASQLTGYESPQRRRFLRELAEEERCSE